MQISILSIISYYFIYVVTTIKVKNCSAMVRFHIEKCNSFGRVGRLKLWGDVEIDHATPSCMIYTRAGHIPHLSWDVVNKWIKFMQRPIFQITLPTLLVFFYLQIRFIDCAGDISKIWIIIRERRTFASGTHLEICALLMQYNTIQYV